MTSQKQRGIISCVIATALVVVLTSSSFGQGRGRGGGGGKGSGGGSSSSHGGGPPSGVGVERGIGSSSNNSGGKADTGRSNASAKSGGRSDEGLNRARAASDNLRHADSELKNHPNLPSALHTNANDLRSGYQAALANNPNLKFGNYVSATRVAQNLGGRRPGITRDAILNGLASGRSLGQTLQDLGLSERQANDAKKQAEKEISLIKGSARKN